MPPNDFYTNSGLFIPTTFLFNASKLAEIDIDSDEFKDTLIELYEDLNQMAIALNLKESGYYNLDEFLTSAMLFPNPNDSAALQPQWRQMFREVVNCGPLPNAGTKSVPHNIPITDTYSFVKIYGAASDQVALSYLPLPYVSTAAGAIEVNVDGTNVNITTQSDRTAYTLAYVIIEYVKQ